MNKQSLSGVERTVVAEDRRKKTEEVERVYVRLAVARFVQRSALYPESERKLKSMLVPKARMLKVHIAVNYSPNLTDVKELTYTLLNCFCKSISKYFE